MRHVYKRKDCRICTCCIYFVNASFQDKPALYDFGEDMVDLFRYQYYFHRVKTAMGYFIKVKNEIQLADVLERAI